MESRRENGPDFEKGRFAGKTLDPHAGRSAFETGRDDGADSQGGSKNDAGRQIAIDLKNMRTPPPDKEVPVHVQLGVYQLLLRENGAEVGGAALVQLRAGARGDDLAPKVQLQPPLESQSPTWIELKLGEAAELLRQERFEARPDVAHCKFCAYRASCPAQPEGAQVIA